MDTDFFDLTPRKLYAFNKNNYRADLVGFVFTSLADSDWKLEKIAMV